MTMHNRNFVLAVVLGFCAYLRLDWNFWQFLASLSCFHHGVVYSTTNRDESDDTEYLYAN